MSRPGSAEGVEVAVARAMWAAGDTVVDVRTADEYALGHLPGAINIPVDRVAPAAAGLPAGHVITTCSAGLRAERAAHRLAALGREALWIRGGVKAWQAAGLPVVTGPAAGGRPPARRRSAVSRLFRALIRKV
jgi:rhodanese-related sulfurtransferase